MMISEKTKKRMVTTLRTVYVERKQVAKQALVRYWWIPLVFWGLFLMRYVKRDSIMQHSLTSGKTSYVKVPCCDQDCQWTSYVRMRHTFIKGHGGLFMCMMERGAHMWEREILKLYCSMTNDCTERDLIPRDATQIIHERKREERVKQYDTMASSARRIVVIIREPLDRFASAFLHFCVVLRQCGPCNDDPTCLLNYVYRKVVSCETHLPFTAPALLPQRWFCELSDYKEGKHLLIPLHRPDQPAQLARQLVQALQSNGVNDTALHDISKIASHLTPESQRRTSPAEKQQVIKTITDNGRLSRMFIETYQDDYMHFDFPLPQAIIKAIEDQPDRDADRKRLYEAMAAIERHRKYKWF